MAARDISIPPGKDCSWRVGKGAKCMTMPDANHIVNKRQNTTLHQRCSIVRTLMPNVSPLRRGRQLKRPWSAKQNLIGKPRIGKLSIKRVRQVSHTKRYAHLVETLPGQVPAGDINKGEEIDGSVRQHHRQIIFEQIARSDMPY